MVGSLSPLAMIAAAVLIGIIILPVAEVASQFSEAGGMYLYARTAFGRFVGLQVGWFRLLAIVGGGAAGANLFLTYLAQFLPWVEHGWPRVAALLVVISIPTEMPKRFACGSGGCSRWWVLRFRLRCSSSWDCGNSV